jgi:hypothetical protein
MSILREDNPITKEYLIEKYNMKPYYYDGTNNSDMYAVEVCIYRNRNSQYESRSISRGLVGSMVFSAYYHLTYDFNSNRVRVVYQDYYKILGGEGKDIMIYNDVVDESDIDLLIDKYNEDIYKTTFDTYNTNDRDLYIIKYNCNRLDRFMQGDKW